MSSLTLYLAIVVVVGLGLLVRALVGLSRSVRRRRDRIDERRNFEAIATATPFEDARERAAQHALDAIDHQTTAARRLITPLILIGTAMLMALPFLSEASAATASLLAAALTVVLGVATRNVIENAIAGLIIATSRTFNIGDTVTVDGHYGTVEDVGITHTTVKIWNWRRFVVPNARLLTMDFVNHSLHDRYEWTKVRFWVAYHGDLEEVRAMAMEAMDASEFAKPYEPARCWVMGLERDCVELWVVGWADTPSEAWLLGCDVRGRIHARLTEQALLPSRHYLAAT